jgi:hypothetical protein
MNIHDTLVNTVTAYDRQQSTKKGYNRYALGLYFHAIAGVDERLNAGEDLRTVLVTSFNGRLLDRCLKALQLAPATTNEHTFGDTSTWASPTRPL